ncbi:hypothetical protein N9A87_04235 [Euryarchaeota archaeon]|nr:hypothetical protein [Euryarchaeota archaeon]
MVEGAYAACHVCGQRKEESPCLLCSSMIRGGPKTDWDYEIDQTLHDEIAEKLGGPHPNTRRRWNFLQDAFTDSKEVNWARLPEGFDPVLEQPATNDELERITADIEQGVKLSSEDRLVLHQGFLMHDGLHFSFQDQQLSMNGRQLPRKVPVVSLLRVLSSPKLRTGWDLSQLMVVFGCTNSSEEGINRQGRDMLRGRIHYMEHRRNMRRKNQPNRRAVFATLTWIGWMAEEHIPPPPNHTLHPLAAWARDIQQRLNTRSGFDGNVAEAFLNHPQGLEELNHYPWLQRWSGFRSTTQSHAPVKWPLRIVGNKLKLRVRSKTGASNHTNVPEKPEAWALLLSLSLSPITSHAGETMFAIQHNWTSVAASPSLVPAPLQRSIKFLNEIMEGNSDRVFVQDKHLLVVGRLGHFYEVAVGKGVHMAPFVIRSVDGLLPRRTNPICIHHGTFHSSVPLGDTMASVVLTLLDDVGASQQIGSLLTNLTCQSPLGFPSTLDAPHLAMLHDATLSQLVANIEARGTRGGPFWLAEQPDQNRRRNNQRPRHNDDLHFNYLMRRNRHRQGQGAGSSPSGQVQNLVTHAAAAQRPVPITALANIWRESLINHTEEQDEAQEGAGERFHNYINNFQRDDWMFIRNHGEAEADAPIGDIRNGERRYCEVFPRIWEAMLLQPIGSTLAVSVADGGELIFEHCTLNVTLRNAAERRLIRRFADLAGYVEQGQDGGRMTFLRRDHPRQWARRNLSESLNQAQERFGFRGAPPWWWHYMEATQAPAQLPQFRWELGVDLRDNNAQRMGGDFRP